MSGRQEHWVSFFTGALCLGILKTAVEDGRAGDWGMMAFAVVGLGTILYLFDTMHRRKAS